MELALGHFSCPIPQPFVSVSILVFVELALGPYFYYILYEQVFGFQSLFLWNLPSDTEVEVMQELPSAVSILVFVELALGLIP